MGSMAEIVAVGQSERAKFGMRLENEVVDGGWEGGAAAGDAKTLAKTVPQVVELEGVPVVIAFTKHVAFEGGGDSLVAFSGISDTN